MTTTLDHVSGGRMILGLGAGWFAREHEAFGFDFGTGFGERLDRLGEAVPLIRRLLDGETVTHEGRFYRFDEAICAPRPVQDRVPILIGGSGPKKTLPLVARYADLWNTYGSPDELAASDAILRAACEAVGRDEREIERTVNVNVVIRRTRGEAERAWAGWMRSPPDAGGRGPPRRRRPGGRGGRRRSAGSPTSASRTRSWSSGRRSTSRPWNTRRPARGAGLTAEGLERRGSSASGARLTLLLVLAGAILVGGRRGRWTRRTPGARPRTGRRIRLCPVSPVQNVTVSSVRQQGGGGR